MGACVSRRVDDGEPPLKARRLFTKKEHADGILEAGLIAGATYGGRQHYEMLLIDGAVALAGILKGLGSVLVLPILPVLVLSTPVGHVCSAYG